MGHPATGASEDGGDSTAGELRVAAPETSGTWGEVDMGEEQPAVMEELRSAAPEGVTSRRGGAVSQGEPAAAVTKSAAARVVSSAGAEATSRAPSRSATGRGPSHEWTGAWWARRRRPSHPKEKKPENAAPSAAGDDDQHPVVDVGVARQQGEALHCPTPRS